MAWFRRTADERRQRALRGSVRGPLAEYLATPFQADHRPLAEVEFLALDYETTGMDPDRDHVVAVGFVPLVGGRIELSRARSFVVAAGVEVGRSATVHGVTDDDLVGGVALEQAMEEVLAALTGRVLLAHFATLERRFTRAAGARLWSGAFECQSVDTLELQRRLIPTAFGADPAPGSLRLWAARDRYGLPVYKAHDPLIDAIACAELFLAQADELSGEGSLTLKSVLAQS